MESRILDAITFQDVFTEGDWRACRQEYDAIAALISPRKEISPTAEQALEKLKELVKGTLKMQKDSYWGYPFLPEMNYFKGQEGYDVAQFPIRPAFDIEVFRHGDKRVKIKIDMITLARPSCICGGDKCV